jgi:hypothetical protein
MGRDPVGYPAPSATSLRLFDPRHDDQRPGMARVVLQQRAVHLQTFGFGDAEFAGENAPRVVHGARDLLVQRRTELRPNLPRFGDGTFPNIVQ